MQYNQDWVINAPPALTRGDYYRIMERRTRPLDEGTMPLHGVATVRPLGE